jgi:multidrug efflux pump
MFARFFIDRPIFASVLSIVITLTGSIAVWMLPVAQYPQIAPPSIIVSCNYPGADAKVVAEAIAAPIEQQVNGVEDMLYMSSQCANDGSYSLTVTFQIGVNLNFAQVLVQNRVNLALPQLPDVVKQTGVTTRRRSPDILLIVSVFSPDVSRDNVYLSNYALIQLRDQLARVDGVGDVIMFGQRDYAMRVWLDPEQLASRGLTANDVIAALREQNVQVAAGQVGQPPVRGNPATQLTLTTLGRLREPSQFADVVIRRTPEGKLVRIKDVGRVELGARSNDIIARFDGQPTTSIAIFQHPDANALDTRDRVRAKMEELKEIFPPGVDYIIGYDTTPFVRESVREVVHTLALAIVLVALVVLLFLQNWRSTIIPLAAVPVALAGTFAVMAGIGFSLNNLTLFGLVLAIGIVVDDAIVVVEAVEHHIERGLKPYDAAMTAMREVSGPVIAVALVLTAVFVPCAFISGIVGQFFRQFALTIAVSTLISAFTSLTLSPALAAILLQPIHARRDPFGRLLDFAFGWLFRLFNRAFRAGTHGYVRLVRRSIRLSGVVLVVYAGLLALIAGGFSILPTGFIPVQDKGYILAAIQLPDSTSLERTRAVVDKVDRIFAETPGVAHRIATAGQSFSLGAYGSNFGQLFVPLIEFRERRSPELGADAIMAKIRARLEMEVPEAIVQVLGPPAVSGLGTSSGFKVIVEDRGELGLETLQHQTDNLIAKARQQPAIANAFTIYRANSPQLYVDVNRDQCLKLGVPLDDVFNTLQVYLGSMYVNDFNLFGRTWQVVAQSEGQFRNEIEDVRRLRVRNNRGLMVPLGSLVTVREKNGPLILTRYNMYPAAAVIGSAAPGVSTGDTISLIEQLARNELPSNGMAIEWTEINYIQIMSGNTAYLIFVLAVMLVFLVLAALYESWSLPLAVILVVPMCLLGSLTAVWIANSDINIFTQVGFVVLVGLASKNAILIVEFAKKKRDAGASILDAALEACQLRLRPILMTSFAFILGVLPLVFASGAGKEMRWALGTAVFGGMIGVTVVGILLTPVFFAVVERIAESSWLSSPRWKAIEASIWDMLKLRWLGRIWRRRKLGGPTAASAHGRPQPAELAKHN